MMVMNMAQDLWESPASVPGRKSPECEAIEKAKRDLECLGHEHELCNRTTLSIIEGCLTEEMMSEWVKVMTQGTYTSVQKFVKLLEFLRDWR